MTSVSAGRLEIVHTIMRVGPISIEGAGGTEPSTGGVAVTSEGEVSVVAHHSVVSDPDSPSYQEEEEEEESSYSASEEEEEEDEPPKLRPKAGASGRSKRGRPSKK